MINAEYNTYDLKLAPARPPLSDNSEESYSTENVPPTVVKDGFFPERCASFLELSYYRGQAICHVVVNPVAYNSATMKTRIYTSITYKVTFTDMPASKLRSLEPTPGQNYKAREISDESEQAEMLDNGMSGITDCKEYDGFINEMSINGIVGNFPDNPVIVGSIYDVKDYLILTVPKFQDAAKKLAGWKTLMGFETKVISRPSWTSSSIHNTVKTNFKDLKKLKYLVLFGDFADLPVMKFEGFKKETAYTDYVYGCVGNQPNDLEQDVYVGRISPRTVLEANTIVDKIINYDKTPVTNSAYYSYGINSALFQPQQINTSYEDLRFVKTSEEIRDYMISKGKSIKRFYNIYPKYNNVDPNTVYPKYWNGNTYGIGYGMEIPAELQRPNYSWNFSSRNINSALLGGAFYMMFRGHGESTGWVNMYDSADINTTGYFGLPVVFSIACDTGHYDDHCFAERLMSYADGGAVAVIASSAKSLSGYNDVLACGIIDAMYPDPGLEPVFKEAKGTYTSQRSAVYSLGEVLQRAIARVVEKYPDTASDSTDIRGWIALTKKVFHIFGDPSMEIRTERPKLLNVINESDPLGTRMELNLSKCPAGTRVTAYDSITGKVSRNFSTRFLYTTDHPDKVAVMIHAHNYQPIITTASHFMRKLVTSSEEASITAITGIGSHKELSYEIPEGCTEAMIIMTDVTGLTVNEIRLDPKESYGKVYLPAGSGSVYGVSLVVDGQVADSKRTIL